jgi:hypothetical protein
MTHVGFCSIFGLKVDEYTDRLVKIFDLDNSNAIGFREFMYGLSKFQVGPRGLHHFSAQPKHLLWDRGAFKGCLGII